MKKHMVEIGQNVHRFGVHLIASAKGRIILKALDPGVEYHVSLNKQPPVKEKRTLMELENEVLMGRDVQLNSIEDVHALTSNLARRGKLTKLDVEYRLRLKR